MGPSVVLEVRGVGCMKTKAEWKKVLETATNDEVRAGVILTALETVSKNCGKVKIQHDIDDLKRVIEVVREMGVEQAGRDLVKTGMVRF